MGIATTAAAITGEPVRLLQESGEPLERAANSMGLVCDSLAETSIAG